MYSNGLISPLSLCQWFSKAKNISSDSNIRFVNEMHLYLLCQVFFRYILIDTNYFFCFLFIEKVSSIFVCYSTYQKNRRRKCPQVEMCRVHLEGISLSSRSVCLLLFSSLLSFSLSLSRLLRSACPIMMVD
jgi:hypothetical protein